MGDLISIAAVEKSLSESNTLDFKEATYADKDKREWLKDVTAFANTRGGRIIIGVAEDANGQAVSANGIEVESLDKEIHKLQSWLREHTDPDVSGAVRIRSETDSEGRKFLVVDIEESESGPHRIEVKSEKHTRQVYLRKGRDNVPASMFEIKSMILDAERTPKLIFEFISDRQSILEKTNPQGTFIHQYVSFHLCPKREFGSRQLVDRVLADRTLFMTVDPEYWDSKRPNIWGVATNQNQRIGSSYVQYFYNGSAELVFSDIVRQMGHDGDADAKQVVIGARLKNYVEKDVTRAARLMNRVWSCDEFTLAVRFSGVSNLNLVWQQKDRHMEGSRDRPAEDKFNLPLLTMRLDDSGLFNLEDTNYLLDLVWRAWGESSCPLQIERS